MSLGEVFSFIKDFIDFVLGFVPHFGRIQANEAGVIISGSKTKELHCDTKKLLLPEGVYFYIPHLHEVYKDDVKRKVKELTGQSLVSKDGKKIRVRGAMSYYITNISTWIIDNEDPEDSVK